jgi:outer membrane protein assembly factor BamB
LSYFPVVFGDVVLVNDSDSIYAYDLQTGKPAWSEDAAEAQARIYPAVDERLLDPAAFEAPRVLGVPRFTMTVAEGRLYARMGGVGVAGANPAGREEGSRLVCLDLARGQGKLLWEKSDRELDADGGRWSFEGSPVVSGSELYVGLRRQHPQPQSNVACFHAETGQLIWNRKICVGAAHQPADSREVCQQLLTLAENSLYYSTNLGALAALDPRDGELRWVVTYPRRDDEQLASRPFRGLTPCVFHEGTLFAAPGDTNRLMALDAETGMQKWSHEFRRQVRQVLGVGQGNVIASGDQLWALDVETGRVAWQVGNEDPESAGYGYGLLAEDLVYWPNHEELLIVHQRTGALQQRVPLGGLHGQTGGNLLIAKNFLLVAQPRKLVAFCEYSRLRQRLENELSARPEAATLHFRLAEVEAATQHFEPALEHFREALRRALPEERLNTEPVRHLAAVKLFELLVDSGRRAADEQQFSEAVGRFTEATAVADDPAAGCAARLLLADVQRQAGDPESALATYQAILSEPRVRSLREVEAGTARVQIAVIVAEQIDQLLRAQGRMFYAKYEAEAAAAFAAAMERQPDVVGLGEVLERYPNAEIAATARLELARLHETRGSPHQALQIYRRILDRPESQAAHPLALLGSAYCFEQLEAWRSAAARWQQLAADFPAMRIREKMRDDLVGEFVGKRLQQPAFHQPSGASGESPFPWVRSWEHSLSSRGASFVPDGAPPSTATAGVLVEQQGLTFLRSSDGSPRWQLTLSAPLIWASYFEELLLLGTGRELRAVTPESGITVWERKLRSASSSPESPHTANGIAMLAASTAASPRGGRTGRRFQAEPEPLAGAGDYREFAVRGRHVLCRQGDRDVWVFDGGDGALHWNHSLTAGELQSPWTAGNSQIWLSLVRPTKLINLDLATGRAQRAAEPWAGLPLAVAGDQLVVMTPAAEIQAYSADARWRWTYAGPVSRANTPPHVLSLGSQLVLVIDGDTLVQVDPATGKPHWSRSLGAVLDSPIGRAAGLDGQHLYVAAAGVLRCFQLSSGDLAWERYLGPRAFSWQVVQMGRYLAAHPARVPDAVEYSILICDATSGECVQRLRFTGPADEVAIHPGPETTLVAAGDRLWGLRKWKPDAATISLTDR